MNAHNAMLEVWLDSLDDRLNLYFSLARERISLKIDESVEKAKLPSIPTPAIPTPVFSSHDNFRAYKAGRLRQLSGYEAYQMQRQANPTRLNGGVFSSIRD